MRFQTASIFVLAIACVALAAPMQDAAREQPQQERDRERGGGRGGRLPLPPDWPRAGGFGPNGQNAERPMIEGLVTEGLIPGTFGRRELTDDDLARAVAVAKEVSPEWGAAIEARVAQEPAQMKSMLRTAGRRLLGLVALKERAPKVFDAKIAELRAQAETERAASELREAEAAGGAKPEAIAALKSALDAAAARQVDATIAARREELNALDERMKRLRADLEGDAAKRGELAQDVAKRAQTRREPQKPAERE